MNRAAMIIIAISTALLFAIGIGIWVIMIGTLASYPIGKAVFVAIWTAAFVTPAVWLGLRLSNRLVRQNREYVERHRHKGE